MRDYFRKTLIVHLRHGRTLFLLSALGVALGVASVLSIQIINANALASFAGSLQAVSGEADLTVLGRLPSFEERLYPRVLSQPEVESAWPLHRTQVALVGREEFFLDVIGLDVFAPVRFPVTSVRDESRTRRAIPGRNDGPKESSDRWEDAIAPALYEPGWTAVTPELAVEMGWVTGDSFEVSSGSRRVPLRVGALVDFRRITPLASSRLLIMDIAQAQRLLGEPGRIHQIDVRLIPGTDPEKAAERLGAVLGPSVQVLTPEQREQQAAGLLSAFRLNLTALSLVSLFVGLFLVYTTTQATLQRRRGEFGLLRSLGSTRRQVVGLILGEALLLGAVGTAAGLPLGYLVARANMKVVSTALTNLYLLEEITRLTLPGWLFLLAIATGLCGALAGAVLPALDTVRRDTRTLLVGFTLHERFRHLSGRLAAAGLAVLGGTILWFMLFGRAWRPGGFVLGLALLVGLPLLTPLTVRLFCGRIRVRRFDWAYSLKGLSARLHASAFAVAALGVAVSMLFGVTLLISGFRRTVDTWIETTVRADIFVTTESWTRGRAEAAMDDSLRLALAGHRGVRSMDVLRQFHAWFGDRRITLNGVDLSQPEVESRFLFLSGDPRETIERMRRGAIIISEPLAYKEGLDLGDTLLLAGPHGPVSFPIAGVACDYTTEGGSAGLDLRVMEAAFGPGPVNNVALYLEPDLDPEAMVGELRARFARHPLLFRSNRRLREEVLAIFDQTFAITRILQGMSLLIAVAGITLTLLVQTRERISELALYRALGARRRQIFGIFLGEGIGMGSLGLLLGLGGGIGLAIILVHFINRAWFGWTIRMNWPFALLLGQGATILVAAALSSIVPAIRASRVRATELSREDV